MRYPFYSSSSHKLFDLLNTDPSNLWDVCTKEIFEEPAPVGVAKGNTYVVELDVPGVKRDDIELTVHENVLTLRTKRGGKETVVSYRIPQRYSQEPASAALQDGVLTLVFDVLPENKPKPIRIEIR